MVLYRKYRPQTLDELVGQTQVKNTLLAAFQSGKLAHGYLFVGPRGTGKTSTARILAKMVNCEGQSSVVSRQSSDKNDLKSDSEAILNTDISLPCNNCPACVSITDGSNLDLIEIDAASNRGIDDIRELREKIKLAPTSAKKKIYIIDEVHMLTTEAFNALLKTLEEPPEHVLFILATTEIQKVPQTILSRVQRLDFKMASVADVIEALSRIAKLEKIEVDEETLKFIAKKADGSFRDGVKLLDQLSGSGQVKIEDVQALVGTADFQSLINLLSAVAIKDARASLLELSKQLENGASVKELTLSLMDLLRSVIFIKSGLGEKIVKEGIGSDHYQLLVELADKFTSISQVAKCLESFQKAWESLKTTSIASLPLELAVVEVCQSSVVSRQSSDNAVVIAAKAAIQIPEKLDVRSEKVDNDDLSKIKEKWTFVLETIKQDNFSLEALLRNVKLLDCSNDLLLLEVPYSFHQRILESPKSRNLLESVLTEVLGKPIKISCVLGTRPTRIEDLANVELAADDEIISLAADIFQGKIVE